MKRNLTLALAAGIGVVAGLRSLTAPAVVGWAAKRKMIRLAESPLADLVVNQASKKVIELAIGELLADKLPFTPDRVRPGPMLARIASGAACGATVAYEGRQPLQDGAILGAVGALLGAFAGFYIRRRLSREMPAFAVALAEDALAVAGGVAIMAELGRAT